MISYLTSVGNPLLEIPVDYDLTSTNTIISQILLLVNRIIYININLSQTRELHRY